MAVIRPNGHKTGHPRVPEGRLRSFARILAVKSVFRDDAEPWPFIAVLLPRLGHHRAGSDELRAARSRGQRRVGGGQDGKAEEPNNKEEAACSKDSSSTAEDLDLRE